MAQVNSDAPTTASAAEVRTSNNVYILSEEHAWVPARVIGHEETETVTVSIPVYKDEQAIQSDGGKASKTTTRQVISLKHYPNRTLPLQNVNEHGVLNEVEDMVDLPFLHEAAILYNIKARHIQGKPYTRTGDIVIAVNPYKWMHDLYSDDVQNRYANILVWDASDHEGDPRTSIEPHVYETSSLAYRGLAVDGQNQSILVSGESGAGKTETTKILMSHIASVQAHSSQHHDSPIVQCVLDSNPLLEAFGNAKTVRNDNSSRFGKFTQLQFDAEDPTHAAFSGKRIPSCVLAGSKSEVYLLEKSRVVGHEEAERSYHIFYQLLAASEETKTDIWDGLADTDNESFSYVGWTDTTVIEGKTDTERFQQTVRALEMVGIEGERFRTLMRAICIVLQLGNLTFEPQEEDEERSCITSTDELQRLSELMGVEDTVVANSLTERTVRARNEVYKVPLRVGQANDTCDAFAKEIYAKAFLWLVRKINDATCAENNYNASTKYATIGLLDIFGFESFDTNRYEQLTINHANEKLQSKFTQDIFRSVQAEYEEEGIALGEITYHDNADVLTLIEGRMGLIAVLNEECVRPKGNDVSFVSKILTMNRDSDCLIGEKSFRDYEFAVQHFAGRVTYDANGFVTKNMDNLPQDLLDCAQKSTNEILSQALNEEGSMSKVGPTSHAKKRPKGKAAPKRDLARRGSSLVQESVWGKFRNQLTSLMANLSLTRTRYIRCIKPNTEKLPRVMQHLATVEQLRCAGVVAAVTISRSAFPNRLEHGVVLDRFKSLWTKKLYSEAMHELQGSNDDIQRQQVEMLLSSALQTLDVRKEDGNVTRAFIIGKTRAYFRAGALEHLEKDRLKGLSVWSIEIQRVVRGFLARSRYLKLRRACITAQAAIRMVLARNRYLRLRKACISIQCWVRCLRAVSDLLRRREYQKATMVQTHWRMAVAMAMLKNHRKAAITIQAMARGAIQRPKFREALVEKREEAKLENQLKSLQKKLEEAEARRVQAEKDAEARRIQAEKEAEERMREVERKHKEEAAKPVAKTPESPQKEEVEVPTPVLVSEPPRPLVPEPPSAVGQLTEQQQNLMDESGRMLEYLRKEVFKLRGQNSQLRQDFDLLKENNQRLMDANASAGASFAALNQHSKQLNKTNAKLVADLTSHKQQIHKLNLAQMELKDELKMKQATYVAEVQTRLQFQKAMGRIIDMIQQRCRDTRLVEDVLTLSDECEAECMDSPRGNDNGPSSMFSSPAPNPADSQSTRSITGALRSFFS